MTSRGPQSMSQSVRGFSLVSSLSVGGERAPAPYAAGLTSKARYCINEGGFLLPATGWNAAGRINGSAPAIKH